MDEQRASAGFTRRSVVRAAAWSAPVIAAAVATPLAAASGAAVAVQMSPAGVTGAGFAWPGATVTNTGTTPMTVTWSVDVSPALESLSGPLTGSVTIPPGGSEQVAVNITGYYVAAAWPTTLTLTLLGDGAPRTSTVTFQAEEQ
ncbi:hypothetical protein ACI2IP_08865 [Microbacterium sp. NPDC090218]